MVSLFVAWGASLPQAVWSSPVSLATTTAPSTRATAPAPERPAHVIDAFIAADTWPAPEGLDSRFGQGIAYVGWRWRAPFGDAFATYNTDTLTLGVDRVCPQPAWCWGAHLKGQLGFAGVLPNFYDRGVRIPEFGFSASYLAGTVHTKVEAVDGLFLGARTTARRWFFAFNDDTDAFGLPPSTWVFEQQLNLTVWSFDDDASLTEAHRPKWRMKGWGFGVEIEGHFRLDAAPWGRGFGDEIPPRPLPERNTPERTILFIRQWAGVGLPLGPVRIELMERAGWGWGEDDLTRARIGGLNPYVVPVAGLPWAAFLSGRYLTGQLRVPVKVGAHLELGPQLDVALIRDILRLDDDSFGYALGVGLFADARWGPWQVELRAGYAPDVGDWQVDQPHLSAFALVGRRFTF